MIENTFKQFAILKQVESVYFLEASDVILGDRGSVRIILNIGDSSFRSYAFRREDVAACVVPHNEVLALDLKVGDIIDFKATVRWPDFKKPLPTDLITALNEAGVNLELLHPREQFQALQMIQESSNSEVRAMRIAAIVATCKTASPFKPNGSDCKESEYGLS